LIERTGAVRELLSVSTSSHAAAGAVGCLDDSATAAGDSLVLRIRAGEAAALGEAYDAHHVHVRAFARRLIGDDDVAEDLLQETFLSLPRALEHFREESSLRSLLISIAINHARHYVRAAARRRAAMSRLACFGDLDAGPATPADEAEREELARQLVRALDALPMAQRVAFVLFDVEGRSSADVARLVGVPEGTVRTRVHHARRKLGEALARQGVR
jgi:RNA polymerase sigma-70 factor (ECF subfamily)